METDMWWNSDILNVNSNGEDIDVALNQDAPPLDEYISALVAIRFLLARHNLEPKLVTMNFGEEEFMEYKARLHGIRSDNEDGSFSWGGFLFIKV